MRTLLLSIAALALTLPPMAFFAIGFLAAGELAGVESFKWRAIHLSGFVLFGVLAVVGIRLARRSSA